MNQKLRHSERRSGLAGIVFMLLLAAGFGFYAHDMWRENGIHQMLFTGLAAIVCVVLAGASAGYWLLEPRRQRFVVEMKLRKSVPDGNVVWATYDVVRCQQLIAEGLGPLVPPPRAVYERVFEPADAMPDRYLEIRSAQGALLQSVPDLELPPVPGEINRRS